MAIDKKVAADTLFGSFRDKEAKVEAIKQVINDSVAVIEQPAGDRGDEHKAKWQTLDRVTVLLTFQQKEGLDRIARQLMRGRSRNSLHKEKKDRERITANTLMRALVDILLEEEISHDFPALYSEEEAKKWLKQKLLKQEF